MPSRISRPLSQCAPTAPACKRRRAQVGGRHQRAGIVRRRSGAVLDAADRIDAEHVLLPAIAAVEAPRLLPVARMNSGLGGSPKVIHDRMQPVWFSGAARGQPERGKVGDRADRPADDIGSDDPLRDRLAGDLLLKQPLEVQRALAVAGEDDRPVAGFLHELVEGGGDVAIGQVERLFRVLALEQEGAVGRLAVARRPDLCRRR